MPRRFDTALMRPPSAGGPADAALLARVRAWCEAGAFPRLVQPLAVAPIAPHPALDALACTLDGSDTLARLPRWQGLAWRAGVLLQDHWPGRAPRPADPWDCGWWHEGALAAAAAFRPRRATLLLVHESPQVDALLATLQAASAAYTRPLRVLRVTPAGAAPASTGAGPGDGTGVPGARSCPP